MCTWIDAINTPPKANELVVIKFGDGDVTAGCISAEHNQHIAHDMKWDVYVGFDRLLTFGVVGWKPLDCKCSAS